MCLEPLAAFTGAQPLPRGFIADIHRHFILDEILTCVTSNQPRPCIDIDAADQVLTFWQRWLVTGKEFTALTSTAGIGRLSAGRGTNNHFHNTRWNTKWCWCIIANVGYSKCHER